MPSKILTYVDSSVLINAIRGEDELRTMRALAVLWDRRREFIATEFLQLETLPYAIHYKRRKEVLFLERFFKKVSHWEESAPLIAPAYDLIIKHDLGVLDALHLAAAIKLKAEFVSAEKPTKPLYSAYARTACIY